MFHDSGKTKSLAQPAIKSTTYSETLVQHIIEANPAAAGHPLRPAASALEVDENSAGQRLDNFLMRELKGVPKTHVYRIIRSGEVRVNKGRAQADTRVQTGDMVRLPPIRLSDKPAQKAEAMANAVAPAREFPVLFEDEHLIALDKPAGVAVHGGSGVSFGVIEQLRRARPQAKFLELVHRLDRETSGILLVAKKRSALKNLQDQFRERETGKTYLALVIGKWPANKKVLDKPLVKFLLPGKNGPESLNDGERRVKVTSKDDPEGMKSVTLVKVAQRIRKGGEREMSGKGEKEGNSQIGQRGKNGEVEFTLLEVTLKTGRTHQIRVHLASQGHSIVGDDKYGDFDLNKAAYKKGLKRMFLHAWKLRFAHPATGEEVNLESPLPAELGDFLMGA